MFGQHKYQNIDYQKLSIVYEKWWSGEAKRPLIAVTLSEPGLYSRDYLLGLLYNFEVDNSKIVETYDDYFAHQLFLGDAFPHFYVRPTGCLSVFMGLDYEVAKGHGTLWYLEQKVEEIEDLKFRLDLDNKVFQRTLELMQDFQKIFRDRVTLGGANLGGVCDIYHTSRGLEKTFFDMIDSPNELKSALGVIFEQWKTAQEIIDSKIDRKLNHGYANWTPILSQKTFDMIQADLTFMISPDDFEEFVLPTLEWEIEYFDRSMFHLDGPGFLNHIDRILSLEKLSGVQWIPGAGSKPIGDWEDLYRQISDSGKLLQVYIENAEEIKYIEQICSYFKDPSQILFICKGKKDDLAAYEEIINKYQ